MPDSPKRLIEVAFPLKQTSLDSVHEKNVRHGHISTLHIWPARRPLAACRAALITTLLPDPGDPVERQQILEKLAGKVVHKVKRKKTETGWVEEVIEETEGGILHWGRESGPDLDWFRAKIREAYGGRAPKVLDPFAGGGAIPLEAMRLGCEATAVDINPVAWFILKCTLEYPQKLAGQKHPLPDFAVHDRVFMEGYLKAQGFKGKELDIQLEKFGFGKSTSQQLPGMEAAGVSLEADLAWHVRAWGMWVLKQVRKELAPYYPTYADFEPLVEVVGKIEHRPMQLVPLKEDGMADIDVLNAEFTPQYLADKRNPRWVAKPTVAYLWARTVTCKNCRATIPLLKTRWLCKHNNKRVVLTMRPNADKTGVVFGIQNDVPDIVKTAAEKKAYDANVGGGTMSRSGAACPCCDGIMTTEDIRLEGQAGRLGALMTTVVVDGQRGKEYRHPTAQEIHKTIITEKELEAVYADVQFGLPDEPTPVGGGSGAGRAFAVHGYGLTKWHQLFSNRQKLVIGKFLLASRNTKQYSTVMAYSSIWIEALSAFLATALDFVINRNSTICSWTMTRETTRGTFARFALPVPWDFSEANPLESGSGGFPGAIEWVSLYIAHALKCSASNPAPTVINQSSITTSFELQDVVVTDPPYYDAIPYSDLMDYFYVWLRRSLFDLSTEAMSVFKNSLSPKWNNDAQDGELVDDECRFNGDREKSKDAYEEGMFHVFVNCFSALKPEGRMVVVFANKQPEAWETLVSAIIRAGFVVDGSWPIQTEMGNRTRALSSSALSTSIWLVCKKRLTAARPGWDNKVLDEMRVNIATRLRDFWDAGIRGPDFVWAATGPAMEAYSQYPVVKKANEPGAVMTVSEFLTHVRRMVVDFVVGRVLNAAGAEDVSGLDNITTYYLLHRHDFGLKDAPAGPCILYAVSCGLSDKDLADRYDILARRGGKGEEESEDVENEEAESEEGSGSSFRLKAWNQRKHPNMGIDPHTDSSAEKLPLFPDMEREVTPSREIPLIDQIHRLMLLWKGGDVSKVNEYLDLRGLRRSPLFHPLLQALIEMAPAGSEERSLMESISNHVGGLRQNSPSLF